MRLILAEPFKSLWAGKDAFAEVERLQGQVYRELEARRTLRAEVDGRGYFVKIHRGVGWGEIVKNLSTWRLPVLGAGQEWKAIQRLTEAGVPTMTAVAYGERGSNPAQQHSFIITEELAPTIDLEQLTQAWPEQPPLPGLKWALILRVADMTGRMHAAGVNHRDCYICHFLLHTDKPFSADDFRLSVIDLHRAQLRPAVPRRWRDKDLAGLYFSALNIGLTQRDFLRFLKGYFAAAGSARSLRQILRDEAALLAWLQRKAERLLSRYARKYETGASHE
ncbi:lipopolysaccharide core heptose(I) kinase RfaP [Pseudomonas daroniae]|uniref:Lipopolysaccharide core heptose(I) kinase n=1 Tax=Phytopseudomonas daroniae TaxID=2487519 RepID=A0A4Q9QSA8_9GAMM|nr:MULTISPECIES: lipopolysaccharide core heptose(I) kinase RfaP [Pseudomonas]TBU83002.1 lipopolysaccharide core heptose(I) kinase RfaP [Pseudomonas sp. FRB 228]TBU83985.1 lipopolysaccharide core heptose(I) kinase RfaP [Pseudomonas daroniae]TBU93163.1 lipopolysaccharide core heptose(I) kinase RfaP [Pseudomonas daroniae]